MPIPMLFLPPQSEKTREWAKAVAEACPELEVIIPETREGAEQAIALAEGAFGTIPVELLPRAGHLRWLQAPQAAPPAGYYYPELIAHPVAITNFREIYNDHIAAHIMSFVLAFARGLQVYLPQQLRREWRPVARESGDVVHLPEATALIVGVGGIGAEAARLAAAFGIKVIGIDERRADKPAGVTEMSTARRSRLARRASTSPWRASLSHIRPADDGATPSAPARSASRHCLRDASNPSARRCAAVGSPASEPGEITRRLTSSTASTAAGSACGSLGTCLSISRVPANDCSIQYLYHAS